MTPTAAPAPPAPPRAQLIHIETDRRLGHEWDEWDGRPLPNRGDFSAPARLFFGYAALTLVVALGVAAAVLFLLQPRLATLHPLVPRVLWLTLGGAGAVAWAWLAVLALSFYLGVSLLPERLLERGPFLRLMNEKASELGLRDTRSISTIRSPSGAAAAWARVSCWC